MLDSETKNRINKCRDILVGKVPDPKSQVEQITFAMLYKFMNDMDAESEELGGTAKYFDGDHAVYNWNNLLSSKISSFDMFRLYETAIREMPKNKNIPPLFREIFSNAYLPYRDEETLRLFLREINGFTYEHSERLGDAFEYLLSILGSQGDAGQFRTPRHIIDFMVDIIDPKKDESILDPACGTAGFLISAYNYITEKHDANGDLASNEVKALQDNIKGYDISPDMVRLSLVNMYLHDIQEPHIDSYDTLTNDNKWDERFDVILANPPFMNPRGGIRPHRRFSVQSNRSEVLFVDYIAEHLASKGRAAVVVPEGIIFQSGTAYKKLRETLIQDYLIAVISLPSGVFNPYSGVKTSILIFDKVLVKKTDKILFAKIENDGYHLGARRSAIEKNDIPAVAEGIKEYLSSIHNGKEFNVEGISRLYEIPKEKIKNSDDYNLNGEIYKPKIEFNSKFKTIKLGDICHIQTGKKDVNEGNPAGKYPFFTCAKEHTFSDTYSFDCEAILIAGNGAVGQTTFTHGKFEAYQRTYVLTEFNEISPKLLLSILDRYLMQYLSSMVLGNTIPYIKKGMLENFEIPVPPIEIQKEIVTEIESYQKIIDGARMVVENYQPTIEIDSEWEVIKLSEVTDVDWGNTSITKKTYSKDAPYLAVSAAGIDGRVDHYEHDVGVTVVSAIGAQCGAVFFPNDKFTAIKNTITLTPKTPNELIEPKYLFYILQDNPFPKRGSAQPFISKGDTEKMLIILPPIEIQKEAVIEIEKEQKIIEGNKEAITIFEAKIKAVMERVWTTAKIK